MVEPVFSALGSLGFLALIDETANNTKTYFSQELEMFAGQNLNFEGFPLLQAQLPRLLE